MFAVIPLCAECEIICRGKPPTPCPGIGVFYYIKAEILAMVVLVVGEVIKQHPAVHLLHIIAALGYIASEREKI